MKIMITGFEPFNGASINPSQEIVGQIKAPQGAELFKEILPVEFKRSSVILKQKIEEYRPDRILCIGQAGNRPELCVERVALNLDCVRSSDGRTSLADNAGELPVDRKIEEDGEAALFSNLPVWELVEAIQKEGVAAAVSYTAGTYVCNHVMYTALYEGNRVCPESLAGFIHVPFLPFQLSERGDKKPGHAMELEEMIRGVQAAVDYLVSVE